MRPCLKMPKNQNEQIIYTDDDLVYVYTVECYENHHSQLASYFASGMDYDGDVTLDAYQSASSFPTHGVHFTWLPSSVSTSHGVQSF